MARPLFLDALKKKVLIFDGAMGTNLQNYNLTKEDFGGKEGLNDYLVITKPQVVREIHEGFLKVGVDCLETNTFGSNRLKLDEYGIGDQIVQVNTAAVKLARELADKYSTPDQPRFVVGSMGPTGMLPASEDPDLGKITVDELEAIYYEQACIMIDAGVDALLVETSQDILEMRAAVFGCHRARTEKKSPSAIMAQTTLDTTGRMLLGTDIGSVLSTFSRLPIDVIGMNCSTGPKEMKDPVRYLSPIFRDPHFHHPQRRAARKPGRPGRLSPEARGPGRGAEGIRRGIRRQRDRRLLRHHPRASAPGRRGHRQPRAQEARRHPPVQRLFHDQVAWPWTRNPSPSSWASGSIPRAPARSSRCSWPTTTRAW